jgi:hypothetical protein
MDPLLEQFWEDLESGEVHVRDRWQFTLKSEFYPYSEVTKLSSSSQCIQEFYLFVPSALQINKNTYTKSQFYEDQTNLIRYKTPLFTFEELFDEHNSKSPLSRMFALCHEDQTPETFYTFTDELKLLANIARSTLRNEIKEILEQVDKNSGVLQEQEFKLKCEALLEDIKRLRNQLNDLKSTFLRTWNNSDLYRQILYVDEFSSEFITYYLTGLLDVINQHDHSSLNEIEDKIKALIIKEDLLTEHGTMIASSEEGYLDTPQGESIIHKKSLLNKYVLDALQLYTSRFSLDQSYQNWIGALSAAIAMLFFFLLYVWLGTVFLINSAPFIALTVLFYVLKDRIKEWMRILSYQNVSRWFPDYTTVIFSPDKKYQLGTVKESFSFIEEPQLSEELRNLRNAEFHSVLETVRRPESVLYYKRGVLLNISPKTAMSRRSSLNIIFRYNIDRFLRKASEPFEEVLTIDPSTNQLVPLYLPKVYHLNLIIRTTLTEGNNPPKIELKKLRIIIDKNGIKRIEQISRR